MKVYKIKEKDFDKVINKLKVIKLEQVVSILVDSMLNKKELTSLNFSRLYYKDNRFRILHNENPKKEYNSGILFNFKDNFNFELILFDSRKWNSTNIFCSKEITKINRFRFYNHEIENLTEISYSAVISKFKKDSICFVLK